jgi:hypothetical protein
MSVTHANRPADRPSAWAVGLLAFSVVAAMAAFALLAALG